MREPQIRYAWYSKKMYEYTNTLYIYTDKNNNIITATIISNSEDEPMTNSSKSIYKDFKYLGPVIKYIKTKKNKIDYNFQKKISCPKPLSF